MPHNETPIEKFLINKGVTFAAGGLLWRGEKSNRQIALVFRKRYKDWTLPKGKIISGEDFLSAAQREVKEETGFDTEVLGFAGCVCYEHQQKPKIVLFWHLLARGISHFKESEEVERCEWLSVEEAVQRLTYPKERDLLLQNPVEQPIS